jgi:serine/threonine protein kinase/tetratricopeptide (TPR) repeat protein
MYSDRNLLFGILAVQSGFCTARQLVEAMNAWTLAKERPMGDILLERGHLKQDEHDLIAALVAKQLERHGGDAEKSLATLTPMPRVAAALQRLADADVQRSVAGWAAERDDDPDRTRAFESGSAGNAVRYRILRPHARGGLGEVFVARDEELGREVALKEIQPEHADNMDSRGRFVREAEVTGGLEHPGIVAVYGLGSYADGRPFYAMRFIQGDSLKEAIERFHARGKPDFSGSEFRQLLGRFVDVCQAIAYAHSRGVLHRDLKPGNIMLGRFGETLVVDWGLAKVVGTKDADSDGKTLNISSGSGQTPTVQGRAIGTPAFMSPEQAAGRLDELGPATDVYSLGATLYALLANRPPVQGADLGEILRKSERGEWTPLRAVNPAVPAPLAAIGAMAMAPRPADRYASVLALAADIERYLADEPVSAHRDPFPVRARRWARKHRTAVATAAAALLVGAVAMGVGLAAVGDRNVKLKTANIELDDALKRESMRADGERAAKELAVKREVQLGRTNQILLDVFTDVNVESLVDRNESVESALAKRLVEAGGALSAAAFGDSLSLATLQDRLGVSLGNLGHSQDAIPLLRKAAEARRSGLGPRHPATLATENHLAMCRIAAGHLQEGLRELEDLAKAYEAQMGKEHPDTLFVKHNLAGAYTSFGRYDLALSIRQDLVRVSKIRLSKDDPELLDRMGGLGELYHAVGRIRDALPLLQEVYEKKRARLGPDHPSTLSSLEKLASVLRADDQLSRALPLHEELLKARTARLGADHPKTLHAMVGLGGCLQDSSQHKKALPLYLTALQLAKAKLGADHPTTLRSLNSLATCYQEMGTPDKALPLLEEVLRLRTAKLGSNHPNTLVSLNNLGLAHSAKGDREKALAFFEAASRGIELRRFEHDHAGRIVSNTAEEYEAARRFPEAEGWRRKWASVVKARSGAVSLQYAAELSQLGENLLQQGKYGEADSVLRECLKAIHTIQPEDWNLFSVRSSLGSALLGQKKYAEAEAVLLASYQGMKAREKNVPSAAGQRHAQTAQRLIDLYTAMNKPEEVKKWQAERAKYAPAKDSTPNAKP